MSRDDYEDWSGQRTRRGNSGGHRRQDDSWPGGQDQYGQQNGYGGEGRPYSRSGPYDQPGQSGPYDLPDPFENSDLYGQTDPRGAPYQGGYPGQAGYPGEQSYADPYQVMYPETGYDAQGGYDQQGYGQYPDAGGYDSAGYDTGQRSGYRDGYNGRGSYDDGGGYGGQQYPAGRGYLANGRQSSFQPEDDEPERGRRAGRRGRVGYDDEQDSGSARQRGRGRRGGEVGDGHDGFFGGFGNDDDDVDLPRRRRVPAGLIALFIVFVIIGGIGGVGYHYYHLYKVKHQSFSGPGTGTVDFTVPQNATGDGIGPQLVSLGVVGSQDSWASYVRTQSAVLQPGKFVLRHGMSNAEAWKILTDPADRISPTVTIVDGDRIAQILPALAQESHIPLSKFESAIKETSKLGLPSYAKGNPQGYLYPDTYDIVPGMTALQILQKAVSQFNVIAAQVNLVATATKDGFTPAEVITEASLLEAEVPPKYYGKVATVIDNRLNNLDGMTSLLELDSTVAFATNKFIYNLSPTDLKVNSPYNTFIHPGLPPGPIDSPLEAAIEAALHPTPGPWTYFVTVNKKQLTLFTNSQSQFEAWSREASQNGV